MKICNGFDSVWYIFVNLFAGVSSAVVHNDNQAFDNFLHVHMVFRDLTKGLGVPLPSLFNGVISELDALKICNANAQDKPGKGMSSYCVWQVVEIDRLRNCRVHLPSQHSRISLNIMNVA